MRTLYAIIFQLGILCLFAAWLYAKFYNRFGGGGRLTIKQIWKQLPLQSWGTSLIGIYMGGFAYLRVDQQFKIRDSAGPFLISLAAMAGSWAITSMIASIFLQQVTRGRGINTAQSIRLSFLAGVIILYGITATQFTKANQRPQTPGSSAGTSAGNTSTVKAYQAHPGEVPPYLSVTDSAQIVTVRNNLKAKVWVRIFVRPIQGGASCTLRNTQNANTSDQQTYSSFIEPNQVANFYRVSCPMALDAPLRIFVDSEGMPLFETRDDI